MIDLDELERLEREATDSYIGYKKDGKRKHRRRHRAGAQAMKKPKRISLDHGERIIAVVPEYCAGPGWSNSVVWVYIKTNDGALREECIQPEERTAEMSALFGIGAAAAQSLLRAVPVKRHKEKQ